MTADPAAERALQGLRTMRETHRCDPPGHSWSSRTGLGAGNPCQCGAVVMDAAMWDALDGEDPWHTAGTETPATPPPSGTGHPSSPATAPAAETTDGLVDQRYADAQAARYDEKLAQTARGLRELADEIEREGKARPASINNDGKADYLWAAEQVIHSLHWGLVNLNVETLLSAAADAHSAVRGRIK